jgi:hypothetical protein
MAALALVALLVAGALSAWLVVNGDLTRGARVPKAAGGRTVGSPP